MNRDEENQQRSKRFYADRAADRHHHHRHPGGDRHPDVPQSALEGQGRCDQRNCHQLVVGIESYAVDNNDTYPAAGSLNTSLASYIDNWPKNPYQANAPMAYSATANPGYYNYTLPASNTFQVTGWLSSGTFTLP